MGVLLSKTRSFAITLYILFCSPLSLFPEEVEAVIWYLSEKRLSLMTQASCVTLQTLQCWLYHQGIKRFTLMQTQWEKSEILAECFFISHMFTGQQNLRTSVFRGEQNLWEANSISHIPSLLADKSHVCSMPSFSDAWQHAPQDLVLGPYEPW